MESKVSPSSAFVLVTIHGTGLRVATQVGRCCVHFASDPGGFRANSRLNVPFHDGTLGAWHVVVNGDGLRRSIYSLAPVAQLMD